MPRPVDFDLLLGDAIRTRLLWPRNGIVEPRARQLLVRLAHEHAPWSVTELAASLAIPAGSVSKALAQLRRHDLIVEIPVAEEQIDVMRHPTAAGMDLVHALADDADRVRREVWTGDMYTYLRDDLPRRLT